MGIILFEFVAGFNPLYKHKNLYQDTFKNENFEEFWKNIEKKFCKDFKTKLNISSELKSLIQRMLAYDPEKRPSCS